MVDNDPNDYRRKLKKLSKREAQVLVLRCQGMNYAAIGKALSIVVSTVKTDVGRIYVKLGLDVLEPSVRHKVLYDTICPLLKAHIADEGKKTEPAEDVIDGDVIEEGDAPLPKELLQLVEYDERALVAWHPAPLAVRPLPRAKGPRTWPIVLALGVILGTFLGGGAVYVLMQLGVGGFPLLPQPSSAVLPPPANPSVVPSPLPPSTVEVATTEAPTSIPPSDTPVPTATVPSPTAIFVPPADGILFEDDFENGPKADWNLGGEYWITANGALTESGQAAGHGGYSWVTLNEPAWKNYILSTKIVIPYMGSGGQSNVAAAIRVNGQAQYLGVQIRAFVGNALFFIGPSDSDSRPVAGSRVFDFESGSILELEANGNTFTVRVDGRQVQQVSLPGYDSGGIALGMDCQYSLGCPSFDNVQVRYLP